MGKFKVSFTTALFVFSFIICVIVAVVFVDRSPRKDDYDSFYDKDKPASTANTDDTWNRRPDASPAPTATAATDPTLAELPIDQSLINNTVPVPAYTPAAAAPTVSPVKGRSPEEIARMIRQQSSGLPQTAPAAIPTVSIPAGIATPQVPVAEATPAAYKPAPMRMQSNAPADGSPGNLTPHGLSPGFSTSNVTGNAWPTMPNTTPTPANMQGFRAMPSNNSGTMIGPNKTETDVTPPPGFTGGITREAVATPFSSGNSAGSPVSGFGDSSLQPPPSLSTGGPASSATPASGQLLYAPGSPPGSRSALPPAPTLPPPAIVDPDRPRSDAGDAVENLLTPGSENPEGSSSQALAISGENPTPAAEASAPQDEKIAALVNDIELTQSQAEKLATANALLTEKPLTQDNRKKQVDDIINQWTAITAAAEQAREDDLALEENQFDEYAALRPEMDVEAWKKSLKEAGFSALEVKQRVAEVAYSEKLLEHVASEKYPNAELKKIFDKNPKQYTSAREVHVLEIFKAKPENKDDIKKVSSQMTRLHQQAAQGTDFGLLANQASEAASKHKGGDRGWETPTEMKDADLAKVLKTLEPGKVSSVIETDEGYRIVKVTEEKPARDDFDGCRDKVLEKLKNDLRETTLADAKKNQNVVLSPTGRMITASKVKKEKETASASSTKNSSAKKTDTRTKANDSASRDALAATAAAVVAAESKPSTQALNGSKEFIAAHPETQQLAGGQPQPAQQAGGQTPAPTQNMGYTPGATIMVGGNAQTSTMNPAGTTTVNHPAEAVQSNSGSDDASAEELRREAQAMTAQAKAQEQSRTQAAEWQYQQAQAAAYAREHGMQLPSTVGPDGGVAQAQSESGVSMTATVRKPGAPPLVATAPNLPVSTQNPTAADFNEAAMAGQANALPPLETTPATSQSNGWNVTKQVSSEQEIENQRRAAAAQRGNNQQARASSVEGDMSVPGFGSNPINSNNNQGQQSGDGEQKRGIGSRVKSFFGKL